ncbi:ankyrin repeat domain-containing protein [Wolbachia endosymbiont of Cimex lectularius]|uniref:ankyrin repeat domain-containing protein n=1 Tax=Wolbachia endosymbiont of Cimex lectularius TaxID=246273 RepID=UPI00049A4279|nr:ankyrin repeat domain-containing protein [Wolbachia endosymbiont of Cimex lectularius]BAO99584.1 ankyrin repeat domain protein [Wolbachia endosymbiont of Cimex lectularius]
MVKFSKKEREEFNKSWEKLLENSFKNINKKDEKGRTILHYAVGNSDPKTVRLLIKKGADINSADVGGYVPMHLAVIGEHLENVKELISSGAKVNVAERNDKYTPLHLACMIWEVEIVKELVKAGAKVDQPDKSGKTPIDYARNNKEITEVLEGVKIAKKQGEFLEKTVAGVILAEEELIEADKELEEKR